MTRLFFALLLLSNALVLMAAERRATSAVAVQPQILVNGSACLFSLPLVGPANKVTAKWLGHDVTFSPGAGGKWYALAGVSYETKPGTYDLEIDITQRDGRTAHSSHQVKVTAARYKTSRLTVPQKYVTPDPESLKRIEAEKEVKSAAFAHFIATPQWSGDFVVPVTTQVSESYGTSRTFNGQQASVHRGTDFRASMGTPVHASNAGEVVLARELYYEGNCIIIDHGLGFMTIYMHLSKFDVHEGDKVEKDQTIALSGGTGKVTGPHLHLAARWSGEYLDPMKLIAIKLPAHP